MTPMGAKHPAVYRICPLRTPLNAPEDIVHRVITDPISQFRDNKLMRKLENEKGKRRNVWEMFGGHKKFVNNLVQWGIHKASPGMSAHLNEFDISFALNSEMRRGGGRSGKWSIPCTLLQY